MRLKHGQQDVVGIKPTGADTMSANAKAISVYVRGPIIKDKLNYFARVDDYNPDANYNAVSYSSYKGLTSAYEPNNKETFITTGLDFTRIKNAHSMPNVWYNQYRSEQPGTAGSANKDHDLLHS